MYDSWKQSLCVSVIANTGKPMLERIADIEQASFCPFVLDKERDYDDENRDMIYHPQETIPPEGDIAIWKWTSNNGYQESVLENRHKWIQYIRFEDVFSLQELKRKLLGEGENFDISKGCDYLFEFEKHSYGSRSCLFIRGREFDTSSTDEKVCLRDSVYVAPVCVINDNDIKEIKTWRLPNFSVQYYTRLSPPEPTHMEQLRDSNAIVAQIIRNRSSKYTGNLDKRGRTAVKEFLAFIADTSLIDDIAEKCRCDSTRAKEYLNRFIETCEQYYSCTDIDAKIFTRLIASDVAIAEEFKRQVRADWIAQHDDEVKKANDVITDLELRRLNSEQECDALILRCEELKGEEAEFEEKILVLQKQYDDQVSIADNIASSIRKRINDAKTDLSEFFAEYAMYVATESPTNLSNIHYGQQCSIDAETIKGATELVDCLQENLEIAGVSTEKSKALAVYMLSAYATHTPLTLAGYGAGNIINALSATLQNKTATTVIKPSDVDVNAIKKLPKTDIVALYDAFDCYTLQTLFCTEHRPFLCLITMTSEELSVEPRGFFNFTLPLFTEYFISSPCTGDFIGSFSFAMPSVKTRSQLKVLPDYALPPLAMSKSSEVLATAEGITSARLTSFDAFQLQTMPIMLALGKKEELLELVASSSCTEKEKQTLRLLAGDSDG